MLKQPLAIQGIVGIISVLFFCLGIFCSNKSKESKKKVLLRVVSIILWIGTAASAGCFYYSISQHWTKFAIPKIIFLSAIFVAIIITKIVLNDEDDGTTEKDKEKNDKEEGEAIGCIWGIAIAIVIAVYIFIPIGIDQREWNVTWDAKQQQWAEQRAYDANIKPVETLKYREEKIELLSLTDSSKIEGNINGEINGSFSRSFFIASGSIYGNIDGAIKQIDVYKIYYCCDKTTGQMKPMTLEASTTGLFPTKEGEAPYLLKKIYTRFSLDYNVDPPKECNSYEIIEYDLYAPKEAIASNFSLDSQ